MATIDKFNINGTNYDLRDNSKVAIEQGSGNAGKALIVGDDGNVVLANAIKVDNTLTFSGQAADAEVVGNMLASQTTDYTTMILKANSRIYQSSLYALTPDLRIVLRTLLLDALYKTGHTELVDTLNKFVIWKVDNTLNIIGDVSVTANGQSLLIGDKG